VVTDVRKITDSRKGEREKSTLEQRQVFALEQIADTLEAIRGDMIGTQHLIAQMARNSGPSVR
jgi:hypothetical protein